MSSSAGGPLTRENLLAAWLDARLYQEAHDDLRLFHGRRLQAMQAAFSVDLADGPSRLPAEPPRLLLDAVPDEWRGDLGGPRRFTGLQRLFEMATERYLDAVSVFGGYLEAPPAVYVLSQRHGDSIGGAVEATRRAHRRLLLDLLELLWGLDAEARIDRAELLAFGWDPTERPPEPEDYW